MVDGTHKVHRGNLAGGRKMGQAGIGIRNFRYCLRTIVHLQKENFVILAFG